MPVLLVITVGGAPEPVVFSLLQEPRAERILFVCSEASARLVCAPEQGSERRERICPHCGETHHECRNDTGILARYQGQGGSLSDGQWRTVIMGDPQNLTRCIEDMERALTPEAAEWRRRGNDFQVVVDATGGTKCMSMALALVARRWPCRMRYIGGKSRTRSGLGTVESLQEFSVTVINPLEALGYQVVDDALTLASSKNYEGAKQLLAASLPNLTAGVKRRIAALLGLLGGLADWDRFDHAKAKKALPEIEKNLDDLSAVLSDNSIRMLQGQLPDWERRLSILSAARKPSRELVEDLLANAGRRRTEGRYDDATGRLYRAIEALAQWILSERYGIDTRAVSPHQVPPGFFAETVSATGTFKIGIQDDYRLLGAFGHPSGAAFDAAGLRADEENQRSCLAARNQSILAHGFSAIGAGACDSLWKAALQIAQAVDIEQDTLVQFPGLERRMV